MPGEARLQVGGLVGVNDVFLGQLVKHGGHFWELLNSSFLFTRKPQLLDRVAGSPSVIFIMFFPRFGLTNSLLS